VTWPDQAEPAQGSCAADLARLRPRAPWHGTLATLLWPESPRETPTRDCGRMPSSSHRPVVLATHFRGPGAAPTCGGLRQRTEVDSHLFEARLRPAALSEEACYAIGVVRLPRVLSLWADCAAFDDWLLIAAMHEGGLNQMG